MLRFALEALLRLVRLAHLLVATAFFAAVVGTADEYSRFLAALYVTHGAGILHIDNLLRLLHHHRLLLHHHLLLTWLHHRLLLHHHRLLSLRRHHARLHHGLLLHGWLSLHDGLSVDLTVYVLLFHFFNFILNY